MPLLDVSSQTYERLLRRSISFEDDPEAVIKRLLDLAEKTKLNDGSSLGSDRRTRSAAKKVLLPEGEYWLPILEFLDRAGGSAQSRDVIAFVEHRLHSRLTESDWELLSTGEHRWQNRARFARLRMKELGLISDRSPRGIWEITPVGHGYLVDQVRGRGSAA
jgi:hypothetical protein